VLDYHLHTERCCHATGSVEEYLAVAEEKKIAEIGFADHFPLDMLGFSPRLQVTMGGDELTAYISQVEELNKCSNAVAIRTGIEVDYIPGTEEKLNSLLKEYSFDYVIGSIHFMGDWDFTHPVYAEDFNSRNLDSVYRTYYEMVWDLCRCGLFDIIGHIDVVKKFGYQPGGSLEPYWIETARILRETATCFELNTAGRDAPVGEFYPGKRFLEICFAEGVAVTLGSDAHAPGQVGRYFPEALQLLQAVGYRELAAFKKRARRAVPLNDLK